MKTFCVTLDYDVQLTSTEGSSQKEKACDILDGNIITITLMIALSFVFAIFKSPQF